MSSTEISAHINADQREQNLKTIENIFEEFYLIIMKDHYMASFISSHQFMERLIKSQTHFLYKALFELKPEEVYKEYYRIGTIHWKIRLDENSLFQMLDFVEHHLGDRIRTHQINLSFDKLEEVFHKIRNSTGYAYIFGNLEDTLADLKPISEEGHHQMEYLQHFRDYLLKIYKWGTQDHLQNDVSLINSFNRTALDESLATTAFKIKSYANRKQQLQIESLNQNIHKNAELAIKYYKLGEYIQTLLMVKHMVSDTTLLIMLLEQHNHHWQENKNDILIKFLSEKGYHGGLFSITTNASYVNGVYLNTTVFKHLKEYLTTQLNTHDKIFAFEINETLYIYSEAHTGHQFDFIETIREISNVYIEQNHISISDPIINIGFINTLYLQNLTPDELKETIRVLENKTENLPNTSGEVVNSVDFGREINLIIEEIKQNLYLKEDVIQAIENQGFQMHYHQIVHVSSGHLFGAESLVRITQGNKIIPAGSFIEIINDYNLSLKLDLAVINRIIEDLPMISKKLNTLFININPKSLQSERLIKTLQQLISQARQYDMKIILELTEYSLTSELDSLKQLQCENFGVAVDDFGTGYTNFEVVKTLKEEGLIQILKVDGSLVKNINDSETSKSLIEAIILLGTKLGLDVVLEYIEDETTVNKLMEINSTLESSDFVFGQGWYYSKPEPIELLEHLTDS